MKNHEHHSDIRRRWCLRLLGKDKSSLIERTEKGQHYGQLFKYEQIEEA
jgi:hypothetical protein